MQSDWCVFSGYPTQFSSWPRRGRHVLPHLRVERLLLRLHSHIHRDPAFAGLNRVPQFIRNPLVVAVSIRIDFGRTIGLRRGHC